MSESVPKVYWYRYNYRLGGETIRVEDDLTIALSKKDAIETLYRMRSGKDISDLSVRLVTPALARASEVPKVVQARMKELLADLRQPPARALTEQETIKKHAQRMTAFEAWSFAFQDGLYAHTADGNRIGSPLRAVKADDGWDFVDPDSGRAMSFLGEGLWMFSTEESW